jgi:hypothetical protein
MRLQVSKLWVVRGRVWLHFMLFLPCLTIYTNGNPWILSFSPASPFPPIETHGSSLSPPTPSPSRIHARACACTSCFPADDQLVKDVSGALESLQDGIAALAKHEGGEPLHDPALLSPLLELWDGVCCWFAGGVFVVFG